MKNRFIFLIGMLILSAGCATIRSAYGTGSLSERIESSQTRWRSQGAGFALANVPEDKIRHSAELQKVLDRIVYVSPLRGYSVRSFIFLDESLNAFSNGRDIYMNAGLLRSFNGQDTVIAGIMAHELGHVIGNHVKSGFTRTAVEQVAGMIAQKAASQNAQGVIGQLFALSSAGYSRREEKEADIIGAVLVHAAGYDPRGLMKYFEFAKTLQQKDAAKYSEVLAPHLKAYYEARRLYNHHSAQGPAGLDAAMRAAAAAKEQELAIKEVMADYVVHLNVVNGLYRSHPPDEARIRSIALVRARLLGQITDEQMYREDPETAQVYQTIQASRPKN